MPCRKNHSVPKKLFPLLNINPNPAMMKPTVVAVVSIKFSAMMLTTFFERTKPASRKPKPACIKNTRKAAKRTHTVSTALNTVSCPGPAAWAVRVKRVIIKRAMMGTAIIRIRFNMICSPLRLDETTRLASGITLNAACLKITGAGSFEFTGFATSFLLPVWRIFIYNSHLK